MTYRVSAYRRLHALVLRTFTKRTLWWQLAPDHDNVHIVPVGDYFGHLADGCPCLPSTEFTNGHGHGDQWLHFHHSFDDRIQARDL